MNLHHYAREIPLLVSIAICGLVGRPPPSPPSCRSGTNRSASPPLRWWNTSVEHSVASDRSANSRANRTASRQAVRHNDDRTRER